MASLLRGPTRGAQERMVKDVGVDDGSGLKSAERSIQGASNEIFRELSAQDAAKRRAEAAAARVSARSDSVYTAMGEVAFDKIIDDDVAGRRDGANMADPGQAELHHQYAKEQAQEALANYPGTAIGKMKFAESLHKKVGAANIAFSTMVREAGVAFIDEQVQQGQAVLAARVAKDGDLKGGIEDLDDLIVSKADGSSAAQEMIYAKAGRAMLLTGLFEAQMAEGNVAGAKETLEFKGADAFLTPPERRRMNGEVITAEHAADAGAAKANKRMEEVATYLNIKVGDLTAADRRDIANLDKEPDLGKRVAAYERFMTLRNGGKPFKMSQAAIEKMQGVHIARTENSMTLTEKIARATKNSHDGKTPPTQRQIDKMQGIDIPGSLHAKIGEIEAEGITLTADERRVIALDHALTKTNTHGNTPTGLSRDYILDHFGSFQAGLAAPELREFLSHVQVAHKTQKWIHPDTKQEMTYVPPMMHGLKQALAEQGVDINALLGADRSKGDMPGPETDSGLGADWEAAKDGTARTAYDGEQASDSIWGTSDKLVGIVAGFKASAGKGAITGPIASFAFGERDIAQIITARSRFTNQHRMLVRALQNSPKFAEGERKAVYASVDVDIDWNTNNNAFRAKLVGIDEAMAQDIKQLIPMATGQAGVPAAQRQWAMGMLYRLESFRERVLRVPPIMKNEDAVAKGPGTEFRSVIPGDMRTYRVPGNPEEKK